MPLKVCYTRSKCFGIYAMPDIFFSKGLWLLIMVMNDCDENTNIHLSFSFSVSPINVELFNETSNEIICNRCKLI